MEIIVGTSGWMYSHWNGKFYPKSVKGKEQLAYFAERYKSVEINSTFYHMPRETTVINWYETVPENFVFAIKLNRLITHTKKLVWDEDTAQVLNDFFVSISHLKEKLGVVLVQLPPSLKGDAVDRIIEFVKAVRKLEKKFAINIPLAIEFRHKSWFTAETRKMLKKLNVAQVIIDSPNRWPADKSVTADFCYFRFHGSQKLYSSVYTNKELDEWTEFIKEKCKNCKKVFAYFNNDFGGAAIGNAKTLNTKLSRLTS